MSIEKERKQEIVRDFALKEGDTGSPEVQCAILTQNISYLTEHLKINKKDHQCRRGLLAMVCRRKRLLSYLKKACTDRYIALMERLSLRK